MDGAADQPSGRLYKVNIYRRLHLRQKWAVCAWVDRVGARARALVLPNNIRREYNDYGIQFKWYAYEIGGRVQQMSFETALF